MSEEDTPVLDALAEITAVALDQSSLAPREQMIARIAALVTLGAPGASYLLNAAAAADAGLTLEDVQGVLVTVAPLAGTARTLAAAVQITEALGLALAIGEAEFEAALAEELADDD